VTDGGDEVGAPAGELDLGAHRPAHEEEAGGDDGEERADEKHEALACAGDRVERVAGAVRLFGEEGEVREEGAQWAVRRIGVGPRWRGDDAKEDLRITRDPVERRGRLAQEGAHVDDESLAQRPAAFLPANGPTDEDRVSARVDVVAERPVEDRRDVVRPDVESAGLDDGREVRGDEPARVPTRLRAQVGLRRRRRPADVLGDASEERLRAWPRGGELAALDVHLPVAADPRHVRAAPEGPVPRDRFAGHSVAADHDAPVVPERSGALGGVDLGERALDGAPGAREALPDAAAPLLRLRTQLGVEGPVAEHGEHDRGEHDHRGDEPREETAAGHAGPSPSR
jgi:hypothetical protein